MFLKGLKILDLTDQKAAFCSRILSDLGAKVIKVERPEDNFEKSFSYFYNNTGKKEIFLNIKNKEGRKKFLDLVKKNDVVVESFSPGFLDKLDIGFKSLSKTNPKIILASVTGFGQTGPKKDYVTCDLVASAFGGQMSVTGLDKPLKHYGEQTYLTASLFAATGILLALRNLHITGKGDHLDISIQEAVTATLEHVMVRYFYDNVIPKRQGSLHWDNLFQIFPCKDGFIQITLFNKWDTFVEWMDSEGMAQDLMKKDYLDETYRISRLDHIIKIIESWTKTHTVNDLFEKGQLMQFPWAPVQSPQNIVKCPQLKHRRFFKNMSLKKNDMEKKCPGLPFVFKAVHGLSLAKVPLAGNDILSNIRVLDFTRVLSGPYATRILVDFGAEVIKVQSRKTEGKEPGFGGYYDTWNRNKRSITLDMSHTKARELCLRLVKKCDVVVENFSPRVMSNWGMEYETLKKINPGIIMLSMSGMGQTGPWKNHVAFGPTVHSLGGLTYLTSFNKNEPIGSGYALADHIAGLYSAFAVLAALENRDRTGDGQYIDLSQYEVVAGMIGPALVEVLANKTEPVPKGNQNENELAAPHGCYPCKGNDRWCVIGIFNEPEWQALVKVMGHPDWALETRFSTLEKRINNNKALDEKLSVWTRYCDAQNLVTLLQEQGIRAGVVQNARDLAEDPHLKEREFFVPIQHPLLGKSFTDRSPIRFVRDISTTPILKTDLKSSPLLGEANPYVFMDILGMTEDEYALYVQKDIIS